MVPVDHMSPRHWGLTSVVRHSRHHHRPDLWGPEWDPDGRLAPVEYLAARASLSEIINVNTDIFMSVFYGYQRQVGFGEAIGRVFKNYFNFSGRASRSEFWWWQLLNMLVSWFCSAFYMKSYFVWMMNPGQSFDMLWSSITPAGIFGFSLAGLWTIATVIPSLALVWRRLHDIGRTGAWYLMLLIPLVNFVMAIVLIVWWCKGSEGPNRFGPVPNVEETGSVPPPYNG